MAIDEAFLLARPPVERRRTYDVRDTMLYALGLGVGATDPCDPAALRFVYEKDLAALPTMAVVLASPSGWLADPALGIDYMQLLHGEESLVLHRPLAPAGELVSATRIEALFDKGAGRGALLYTRREISDAAGGEAVATIRTGYFLRGDGGFGGKSAGAPDPHPVPTRVPDAAIDYATRADQALLYRLSGDYNPLHIDPAVAAKAGFDRPILHGLCSYGLAGRAMVELVCGGDPTRLRRLDVRFAKPVFPGETLRISVWREEGGRAAFEATSLERDLVVLRNGLVEFRTDRHSGDGESKMGIFRDPERSVLPAREHRKRGRPPFAGRQG